MLKINLHWDKLTKKQKIFRIVIALIFGLAIGAAGFVAYKQYWPQNEPISQIFKKTPKPETTTSALDGTQVSPDNANRHPLAIIIENYTQARPQVGLDDASIVYEAISEGGITRFMALYGPQNPDDVGPVRSMRTYFLDWAWEYNAFLSHVGGNIDALDRIKEEGALDLDQFSLGEKAYTRKRESGKATEHTMFTNVNKLYEAAKDKGWDMEGDFTKFKFLNENKYTIPETYVQEFYIPFSSAKYNVSYEFDRENLEYLRDMGGSPHRDKKTGNQMSPTNIIIQSVERWQVNTRINEPGWEMKTIGEGKAHVIYGGNVIDATWKKDDLKSRTIFYDSDNKEIKFLPGQFWYEIVPPDVFEQVEFTLETTTPETTTE